MQTKLLNGKKTAAEALWPEARRKILGLLLAQPERAWHLREIARQTALSPPSIQREVLALVEADILERRVEPGRVYYQANLRCPIFPELRGIVRKTVGLVDVLREALGAEKGIKCAFVYGSIARGEEMAESDVDIIIIGNVGFGEMVGKLHQAQERLSREVNPTVYTPNELCQKVADRQHFITQVLERPKLFIIGDADVLDGLAQPRVVKKTHLKS